MILVLLITGVAHLNTRAGPVAQSFEGVQFCSAVLYMHVIQACFDIMVPSQAIISQAWIVRPSSDQDERNGQTDFDWACRHFLLIAATSLPLAWIREYRGIGKGRAGATELSYFSFTPCRDF